MAKKTDLPAMPFYFGDWRKAPEIRALDLDVRMIWFEMIGYMWESTERGYLTLNGKPVSDSVITKMLGVDITTFDKALQQLAEFNVFSRREDGAIFCRKMVRDEEKRAAKSAAGTVGMKARYGKKSSYNKTKKAVITKPITNTENETVNENGIIDLGKGDQGKNLKERFEILRSNRIWIDQVCMAQKLTEDKFNIMLSAFEAKCITANEDHSITELMRYFGNWIPINMDRILNKKPTVENRKNDLNDFKNELTTAIHATEG